MSDTTKPITFAIIGSGYMATEHIKAIIDSNECKISGIYSRNYENHKASLVLLAYLLLLNLLKIYM